MYHRLGMMLECRGTAGHGRETEVPWRVWVTGHDLENKCPWQIINVSFSRDISFCLKKCKHIVTHSGVPRTSLCPKHRTRGHCSHCKPPGGGSRCSVPAVPLALMSLYSLLRELPGRLCACGLSVLPVPCTAPQTKLLRLGEGGPHCSACCPQVLCWPSLPDPCCSLAEYPTLACMLLLHVCWLSSLAHPTRHMQSAVAPQSAVAT